MSDRDFLIWLFNRLVHVHGENPRIDYMLRLQAILRCLPETRKTVNVILPSGNLEPEVDP